MVVACGVAQRSRGQTTWLAAPQAMEGRVAQYIVDRHVEGRRRSGCGFCFRRRAYAQRTASPWQCAGLQEVARRQSRGVVERWRHGNIRLRRDGAGTLPAHFSRAGKDSYTVNATCATASGRTAQTARVRQVGNNRYSGSFYNSEYSISGVIHIVVRGASQTVQLISSSGSGVLNLSR